MRRAKQKVILSLTFLTVLLSSEYVQAYFSDFSAIVNSLHAGGNTTEITEEFPDITPTPIPQNPSYQKKVSVSNPVNGANRYNVNCYVRVRLSFSNNDIGKAVTLTGKDTKNWVYDSKSGYYYYRHILSPGEKTTDLFSGFSIDGGKVEATYREAIHAFSIFVYEESVQAASFSNYQEAFAYYGKPIPVA